MATHSSILVWKIPWREEPGRLQSMGSQRVRHDGVTSLHYYQNYYCWSDMQKLESNFNTQLWLLALDSENLNLNLISAIIICVNLNVFLTAKSLQSCPTLCNPRDGSPPGSAIPGILQARTLEWFAISFSNAWKWKVKVKSLSRVWLFATP